LRLCYAEKVTLLPVPMISPEYTCRPWIDGMGKKVLCLEGQHSRPIIRFPGIDKKVAK